MNLSLQQKEAIRDGLAPQCQGYNMPDTLAMLISQWAHQRFLEGHSSYEEYRETQDWAYEQPSLVFSDEDYDFYSAASHVPRRLFA